MAAKENDPPVLILTSLASGPKHGYALLQDIEAFAGVTLGPGTLYGGDHAPRAARAHRADRRSRRAATALPDHGAGRRSARDDARRDAADRRRRHDAAAPPGTAGRATLSRQQTIERLLRSYPPDWRERYGAELATLLGDAAFVAGAARRDASRPHPAASKLRSGRRRSAGSRAASVWGAPRALLLDCLRGRGLWRSRSFPSTGEPPTPVGARAVPSALSTLSSSRPRSAALRCSRHCRLSARSRVVSRAGGWPLIRRAHRLGGGRQRGHVRPDGRRGDLGAPPERGPTKRSATGSIPRPQCLDSLLRRLARALGGRGSLGRQAPRARGLQAPARGMIAGGVTIAMVVMTVADAVWWTSLASDGARSSCRTRCRWRRSPG